MPLILRALVDPLALRHLFGQEGFHAHSRYSVIGTVCDMPKRCLWDDDVCGLRRIVHWLNGSRDRGICRRRCGRHFDERTCAVLEVVSLIVEVKVESR